MNIIEYLFLYLFIKVVIGIKKVIVLVNVFRLQDFNVNRFFIREFFFEFYKVKI